MTGTSIACGNPRRHGLVRGNAPNRGKIYAFHPVRNAKLSARRQLVVLAVTIVDDKTVPDAHKGLHGFLYGDGGSEEHDRGTSYTVRTGEDEGAIVMPVPRYLESRDGEKPLGVYCVYDFQRVPQYIGYSRNMVLAVKGHVARVGPENCAFVRATVYGNRAMASRANLERGVHNWIQELPELQGNLPQGNADPTQRAAWEGVAAVASGGGGDDGTVVAAPALLDRAVMSPAELAAYEEKRLKLRKAMGEKMIEGPGTKNTHGEDEDPDNDNLATRRLKLMKAMEKGDWSVVIDAQTREALGTDGGGAAAAAEGGSSSAANDDARSTNAAAAAAAREGGTPSGGVVSPFQTGGVAVLAGAQKRQGQQPRLLSVEAVQAALEEVRPYLMADGGDVEVVEVKDGVVYLRLQGACSSCPSQSATMKGGIERVIRQNFGDQVHDILQLDSQDPGATVERVDQALNMLRGAISNLGGSAEVLSVEDGICTIRYRGPPAIGKGISGAVCDTFKDIREVQLVD